MSSIRVTNIQTKADASSPTIDEKLKVLNSQGNTVMQVDAKTSGITTVGINTTGNTFTVSGNNVSFAGVVTASSFSGALTGNVTGNLTGNVNSSGVSTFSSGIVVAAGSTAAPSISPTGDSDTGIFFPSADTIAFGEGGAEALRIDSSGRVGLSSTSPKVSLDLSQKTDAIALPQGTTAQRPSGNSPYIRYNTTNSALEFYNGTEFVEIISDYFPSGSTILG